MDFEMLCSLYATSCISLIIRKTLQVEGKCTPMLAGGDPHSHTHTLLDLKQDPRASLASLSAAWMRLHVSKT